MTTAAYQPLRALPPLDQKQRFAWLLGGLAAARRTLDRALSAPRAAIAYVLRAGAHAVTRLMPRPVARVFGWLAGQAVSVVPILRSVGPVTASLVVLTAPPIQRMAIRGLRWLGRLTGSLLKGVWTALDASLRFLGDSGATLADKLSGTVTVLAARVSSVASNPQVRIVAEAAASGLQLVRPLAMGLAVHRLIRVLVPQWWLQWLLEAAIAPLLVDGRLAPLVHARFEPGLVRLATPPAVPVPAGGPAHVMAVKAIEVLEGEMAGQLDVSPVLPLSDDLPAVATESGAFNRAERREQQRQQAQAKRKRPVRTAAPATT
jgi:hypothetical protein